jgi:hypothetical protein
MIDLIEESDDCGAPKVSPQTSIVSYCPQNRNNEDLYMYCLSV